MEHATSIIVIATAAFVLPLLAGRLRLPAVVLEILFGLAAGPVFLGLIVPDEMLGFLAEFGFLLLMFLAGFEIDFGKLERQGPGQIVVGVVVFSSTLGLSYLASRVLGYGPFVTFMLATTSVGLVVPTLRATRRNSTPLGQAILIAALLADFVTLFAATVFALIYEHGPSPKVLGVPLLVVFTAILLLLLKRAAWWFPEKFERLFQADDPEELGIRASLALMFVVVGISMALDVEPILGAFLAGTVFALVFRHPGSLERKLTGFAYGFLIPVFFIHVGLSFEVRALLEKDVFLRAVALLGAALLVKLVPALFLVPLRGLRLREGLAAGMLLTPGLSLIIAVATLGARIGLLDTGTQASAILLAIVTAMFCPALFRVLAPTLPAPRTPAREPE